MSVRQKSLHRSKNCKLWKYKNEKFKLFCVFNFYRRTFELCRNHAPKTTRQNPRSHTAKTRFSSALKANQFSVKIAWSGVTQSDACRLEKNIIKAFKFRLTNKRGGGEIGAQPIIYPNGATHRVTIELPTGEKRRIFCGPVGVGETLGPTKTATWVRTVILEFERGMARARL